MSILLDALKKSEAQRQLGETPNLQTPVEETESGRQGPRAWLVSLMVLTVAVLITILVLRQFEEPDLDVLGYTEIALQDSDTAGSASATANAEQALNQAQQSSGNGRTLVERYQEQRARNKRSDATSPQLTRSKRSDLKRSVSEYQPPAEDETAQASDEQPAAEDGIETLAAAVEESAPQESSAPPSRRRQLAAEDQEQVASQYISYWELPQGVRDSLPEFKISVLVYSDQPEERFILMDGMRLKEKDQVQRGLELDEIRREGAVFTYRDYRFLREG